MIRKIKEYFYTIYNKYKLEYNSRNNIEINTSITTINSINNIDYSSNNKFFKDRTSNNNKEEK